MSELGMTGPHSGCSPSQVSRFPFIISSSWVQKRLPCAGGVVLCIGSCYGWEEAVGSPAAVQIGPAMRRVSGTCHQGSPKPDQGCSPRLPPHPLGLSTLQVIGSSSCPPRDAQPLATCFHPALSSPRCMRSWGQPVGLEPALQVDVVWPCVCCSRCGRPSCRLQRSA